MQKSNFNIHTKDFLLFRRSTDKIRIIVKEILLLLTLGKQYLDRQYWLI